MNVLNQPINPGGHPVFPAAKESPLTPASVRFDGPSHAHDASPRWQARTPRRAGGYVAVEQEAPAPAPPFKPLTLDFLRSLTPDWNGGAISVGAAEAEHGPAPPAPPHVLALRVVVTSAVELDARQTELIARKMRRITGFTSLKIENVVDPSLIAGFVVCYGTDDSHVIDLSVKAKLEAIKNRVDSIDQTAHAYG